MTDSSEEMSPMIPARATLRVAIPAVIACFNALLATAAHADSIKFCFAIDGAFDDNGFALSDSTTEDSWATNIPRRLRGTRAVVKIGTTTYFDGTLGDGVGSGDPGNGCTSTMTVPTANSMYGFQLYSTGASIDNLIDGQHTLNSRIDEIDDTTSELLSITGLAHTGGQGTFSIEILSDTDGTLLWRMHAAAAFVLARVGRWTEATQLDIYMDNDEDADNHYENGDVFINAGNMTKIVGIELKYLIAHEIGHLLADRNASAVGGDCDLSDSQCPSQGGHGMSSKEYQTCAFTEGIAHFFSAATWNDFVGETDCVFRYWSPSTIDCEGSLTSSWSEAYMETICDNTSHTDRGVELDWMRQFWDVQTDGTQPGLDDVMEWVLDGSLLNGFPAGWNDPYSQLCDGKFVWGEHQFELG